MKMVGNEFLSIKVKLCKFLYSSNSLLAVTVVLGRKTVMVCPCHVAVKGTREKLMHAYDTTTTTTNYLLLFLLVLRN